VIKAIVPHDINAAENFVHVIGDFVSIGVMGCLISYDDFIEIFCMILDMVKDQRTNWVRFMLFE
jgi:hypothetical protein